MTKYECVLILDPTLDETQETAKFEELQNLFSSINSEILEDINWGKRKLAYPIKKKENGYYRIVRFNNDPSNIAEIERRLKLDEQVLRFLVVVYDPGWEKKAEQSERSSRRDDDDDDE